MNKRKDGKRGGQSLRSGKESAGTTMRMMITGGAGFIGSNFIYYMLRKHPQYRIICVDALTYAGNLSTLEEALKQPNFRFVRLNIAARAELYRLFEEERPDVVVHFAAESHVDRSIKHPEVFLQTNVLGTAVLMDACRVYGVRRYHQISTDEVYGALSPEHADRFFPEEAPLRASSPYSATKASADLLALAYHRTYGLPVSISRCSNNYGPYHFPEKLIPLTIIRAMENRPIPVYGDGRHVRDWLHVEDHCRAIDAILQKGRLGEIYNVGGQQGVENIDLVQKICAALGKPETLITYVEDRKGHDRRYAMDSSKIRCELAWMPQIPFEEGLRETIRWYGANEAWWRPLLWKCGATSTP